MQDFQGLPRAGLRPLLRRTVDGFCEPDSNFLALVRKFTAIPQRISPLDAAALTISPAAGDAARPPYPAFSMMTAKATFFSAAP